MHTSTRRSDFGTLFSTAVALTSPVQAAVTTRRLYGDVPALTVRPGRGRWLRGAGAVLARWHERARQRRALAGLSDHLLKDVGLRRDEVALEVSKRFWQP